MKIKQNCENDTKLNKENRKSVSLNDYIVETGSQQTSEIEWVITKPKQRSTYEIVNEPIKTDEFFSHLQKLASVIAGYASNPESHNVTADVKPGDIFKKISKTGPDNPERFENVCSDFEHLVLNGLTHWQHPRFHAYFPAGRNYACMLADLAISSLGVVGFSWDSCPALTEMEHSMTNWVGRALGIPETFLFQEPIESSKGGGCLLESSSDAIHNVLLASRHRKLGELVGHRKESDVSRDILQRNHDFCKKFVVYTSKEAHSSIEKGCKLTMMNCRKIETRVENEFGLTGREIEIEVLKDIDSGFIPLHIHVTLGTTSTVASDHLDTIWPIAKKYNMWIHVDAAYSGSTWIIPKYRYESRGIEHVDSLNVNAHKLLQHSVGCYPVYLQPTHHNSNDLRDWGVSLSRRFLCLKSWFVFRLYGIRGLQNYIQNLIDSAIYFENLVATHPNCRIFGKRKHALFCFQYVEANLSEHHVNDLTREFCGFVNRSRLMYFTLTKVQEHVLIRVSVNFEKSTPAIIDDSWRCLKLLIDKFKKMRQILEKSSPPNISFNTNKSETDKKVESVFKEDETFRETHMNSLTQIFSDD
ncbi:unnamed protein product [Auanema sp. JU1783]|nr:unnamed protein product [Auanema sp. JU1783]